MVNDNDSTLKHENEMHLRIVSAECKLFSGFVKEVMVNGCEGGLGIKPGHSPLLTTIASSNLLYVDLDGLVKSVFLYGGILEVQPQSVTVLVDTAIRGEDIDEVEALEAKRRAEKKLYSTNHHDEDYSAALAELSRALSELNAYELSKKGRVK
ncbi:MAG: ATP synthase F1 subunit epsilon [Succinivibrionaceae bacterium]